MLVTETLNSSVLNRVYLLPYLLACLLTNILPFFSQIAEISIRHEQEKAQTLRAHQMERDSLLKEHEQGKVE